jgi:hypothetical protein
LVAMTIHLVSLLSWLEPPERWTPFGRLAYFRIDRCK